MYIKTSLCTTEKHTLSLKVKIKINCSFSLRVQKGIAYLSSCFGNCMLMTYSKLFMNLLFKLWEVFSWVFQTFFKLIEETNAVLIGWAKGFLHEKYEVYFIHNLPDYLILANFKTFLLAYISCAGMFHCHISI
jgi:hypothetical protein